MEDIMLYIKLALVLLAGIGAIILIVGIIAKTYAMLMRLMLFFLILLAIATAGSYVYMQHNNLSLEDYYQLIKNQTVSKYEQITR